MCGIDAEAGQALIGGLFSGLSEALIPREVECGCDQGRGGKISKQWQHTQTHTSPHSPPPNNPLILFIISQLFLVLAIHERNHAHKHTPMCRAEIQYKYSHLPAFISPSVSVVFFLLLCVVRAGTHHNPTSIRGSRKRGGFAFSRPRRRRRRSFLKAKFLGPELFFSPPKRKSGFPSISQQENGNIGSNRR